MGVTMAGTRILWGEVREIGEGRSNSFNTQRAEMKLGYLRVCYRPSDNPGFIWKVALSIARYLALCLSRSLGSRFDPSYPAMQWIHHKWQQPDPSYPAITWPLLPRHAMLRGHRHKHANLSPGVNIECVGEGGRVSTAHVFQCVFHGVKDPWKTQWKTCYFSVLCLKDVPTNDRRNIFVLDFLYDATSFIQSIENSHVFQWVFHCVKDVMKDPTKDVWFICVLSERRAY